MARKKNRKRKTTATRSASRPTSRRDPREIGAEWDVALEQWTHPCGDEYLRVALSSDADFAAAKVAEEIAQYQRLREPFAPFFETGIQRGHIVVLRRS